jgi:hypothetical protein
MLITIPVVMISYDNGDGSKTSYVYNDMDELVDNYRGSELIDTSEHTHDEIKVLLLSNDDPYENGYVETGRKIEIDLRLDGGQTKLAKPFTVYSE